MDLAGQKTENNIRELLVVRPPTISPLNATTTSSSPGMSFSYTGSVQTYVVPNNANYVKIYAAGANGGQYGTGFALGGFIAASGLFVTSGQVLYVYVGGQGTSAGYCNWQTGTFNGGGGGNCGGGSGGGASDVRTVADNLTSRLIVAGGGGGGAYGCGGGAGGGLVGHISIDNNGNIRATGGSQSSGGTAYLYGNAGMSGVGGNSAVCGTYCCGTGGGGGGGYYGGGAGSCDQGGGGGSSFVSSPATIISNLQGVNFGSGNVTISAYFVAPTTSPTVTPTSAHIDNPTTTLSFSSDPLTQKQRRRRGSRPTKNSVDIDVHINVPG